VDDPIKNAEQAMSPTYREKIWDWWQSTADTRLSPNGIAVVMYTPWHRDDLGGTLKARSENDEGTPAHVIRLPALAEANDPLGREEGGALWPQEWSEERLADRRRGRTSYWWNALYQCNPTTHDRAAWPEEYWRDLFVDEDHWPDEFEWSVVAVDPSKGKLGTKKGDFCAAIFLGLSGGKLWVDALVEKIPLAQIVPEVLTFSLALGCNEVGFESDQFQELLTFEWERVRQDVGLGPKPAHQIKTGGVRKETRIERLGPYFDQKVFRFRRGRGTERLLGQLREFPLADHDDGPDAMEMATRLIESVYMMEATT
jgi:predicted phage terminase large subunit-like protein